MCTQAQLNNITKAMVNCYRVVYGDDIVDIILYGSYARGNYTEDSDIVALVHGSREDLQARLKKIWDMSAEFGLENDIIVSSTVVPYDEFMKYKQTLPYYRNIAEGLIFRGLMYILWVNAIIAGSDIINSVLIAIKPSNAKFCRGYYIVEQQ